MLSFVAEPKAIRRMLDAVGYAADSPDAARSLDAPTGDQRMSGAVRRSKLSD